MKETIRTASVLEIYNEAIKGLNSKKQKLQIELTTLKGKDVAVKGAKGILKVTGIILIVFGSIIALLGLIAAPKSEGATLVVSMLGIGVIFLGTYFISKSNKKGEDVFERVNDLKNQISVINNEIEERKIRKKSLLEAEEVIVSKDLKNEELKMDKERPTQPFNENIQNTNEKVCPMCAETVKFAAKICRFCGHKFEEI